MSLSQQEAEFLARLAASGQAVFTAAEAQAVWTGSGPVRVALHRLASKSWLKRLQRGVYLLVPLEAGPQRAWTESPLVIAPYLIRPAAVAYWSALHYWGLTEQFPRITFVQSTRRKPPVEILGMRFRFVAVKAPRFFGVARRSLNGKPIAVTDREKTLIDCADRPELGGGGLQLAQALQAGLASIDWPQLDAYLARWGGGTVVKRLGFLVEHLGLPIPRRAERLAEWQQMLSRGVSPLEPGADRSGPVVTRWRLRVNVPALAPRQVA